MLRGEHQEDDPQAVPRVRRRGRCDGDTQKDAAVVQCNRGPGVAPGVMRSLHVFSACCQDSFLVCVSFLMIGAIIKKCSQEQCPAHPLTRPSWPAPFFSILISVNLPQFPPEQLQTPQPCSVNSSN